MRVEAYRNLHNDSLSVRNTAKGGHVFTRPQVAQILNPTFVVQPKGRERVLRERRKNVHAFVRGEFVPEPQPFRARDYRKANYNPYLAPTFTDNATGEPVTSATVAFVTPNGVYYR